MTEPEHDTYEAARVQFQAAGLPFPFIPPALRGALTPVAEWFYTTDAALTAEGQPAVFNRLKDDRLPDFAAIGQIGHGSNSWVVRYQLAQRPLLLTLEYSWGGAYSAGDADAIRERFDAAERLIVAATSARFAPGEYVAVIDTPVTGGHWLRLRVPSESNPMTMQWTAADDPIAAAREAMGE
jgi:hypothetical protein